MAIVKGSTVIGEICHIKAAKRGGSRYDDDQTSAERNGYNNLILLCPTHHTVVDSDVEAYTAERLTKMKQDHENRGVPLSESEIGEIPQVLINESVNFNGQSGGISAHTINANSIIMATPHASIESRRRQSIEMLWNIIVKLRTEFGEVTYIDSMLTSDELAARFSQKSTCQLFDQIRPYAKFLTVNNKFERAGVDAAESERPYLSQRLYGLFFTLRAVYGRAGVLLYFSFRDGKFQSWRDDAGMAQHINAIFPERSKAPAGISRADNLYSIIRDIENEFIEEAGLAS
jgi:hypothetical protein